jgi:orotate phosphoribosyltransferase
MEIGEMIARASLEIGSIKLNTDDPFTWASGFRMPIYNDNRMFLGSYDYRMMIADGFMELLRDSRIHWYGIAGTSTSGIPPATTLADLTHSPLIYVRDKPKGHGLRNQIEGIDAESDLEGRRFVLIEDLISTGGSSARAVQAIRDANGDCRHCLSIFNYGLSKADEAFGRLGPECEVKSLLTYDNLLEIARETEYITDDQVGVLAEWRNDPFGWGEKRGFPKVEKK